MAPSTKRRGRPPRQPAVEANVASIGEEKEQEQEQEEEHTDGDFLPPSISSLEIFQGKSYTFHSQVPEALLNDSSAPVTLGVDEAGRGPVLGPMVYGVAFCLSSYEKSLSSAGFDDSKKLTTEIRTALMQDICSAGSDNNTNVGWAVRLMSARDIGAGMLRPAGVGTYNLNAQAHDATIMLIQQVIAKGVNVKEIYVDTVGPPATYQAKLARLFPACKVTVSKKADSLYPSVSVASVVAKVSRDFALEQYFSLVSAKAGTPTIATGSGYPSDPKTAAWLRNSMDDLFGWGSEARFSWSTAADMLKKDGEAVEWAEMDEEGNGDISALMSTGSSSEIKHWFGKPVTASDF